MIKTKRPANESVTFRINSSVLERLAAESDSQKISLNALVNQILANYAEWDVTAAHAGWMLIPRDELQSLINKLEDDEIVNTAKNTAARTKDVRLLMTNKNDLDGFVFILRNRCIKSGFQYKEMRSTNVLKIIIQHDMGRKWSLFTKTLYDEIINDVGHRVSSEYTDNTLMLEIDI
ncbi:MAG: toxin-antitoxin system HicB family antitoxin [Thermoproteota archaeon]